MALFIVDFDHTIVDGNTHNALYSITSLDRDHMWGLIQNLQPIGSREIWQQTLRKILANHHKIAVASFNAYGSVVIPMYLEKMIGLTPSEIKQIHIESWLPSNPDNANKNEHIAGILKDMKYTGKKNSIILVDDDPKNIAAAQEAGFTTIIANGMHMKAMVDLSLSLLKTTTHRFFEFLTRHKDVNAKAAPEVTKPPTL